MSAWKHFKTITKHHFLVQKNCFKVGLFWQGLTHDLSKLSPTEFFVGAKYYQGTRSPNNAEREDKGYSEAWMHHKGRNRHHFEYWIDYGKKPDGTHGYISVPMPKKYIAEMLMDRIAASRVYEGENYTDASALQYFRRGHAESLMHPETYATLEKLLIMLSEKGEKETFLYVRKVLLQK